MNAVNYHHGIETVLVPDQAPPIKTAKSSVVGMVITAGMGPVNTPVIIAGSRRKAAQTFGEYRLDGFTGPESFAAMFDQGSVTVIAVNACNPEIHNEDVEGEEVTLDLRTHKAVAEFPYHRELTLSSEAKAARKFTAGNTIAFPAYLSLTTVSIGETNFTAGVKQVETATVAGTITGAGNVSVTVTAAGMSNSPKVIPVAVAINDTAADVATKVRAALAADTDVAARFDVSGANTAVILTRKIATANDATLNIALAPGTATGLTAAANSADTTAGAANDYYLSGDVLTRSTTGTIPEEATVMLEYAYTPGFDAGTDFVHDPNAGSIFRPVTGSHILPGSTLTIDYNYVDPSKVTEQEIIGTVAAQTTSGLQAIVTSPNRIKIKARILVAPRFTETYSATEANPVITALNLAAKRLGGRVICDAPNIDRDSAMTHASFYTGDEDRVYMHFPYYVVSSPVNGDTTIEQPSAARIAGHIAMVDNEFGFWNSPSNRQIKGVLALSRDLTYGSQDKDTDVDLLNSNGVATTVFDQGFRLWGNRQTNMQHISVQRISDMITEAIAVSHIWAVDRNITKGLIEQIIESIRAYLRVLESIGALIPNPSPESEQFNDAWADPELNTPDSVAEGNLYIDYRFNPPFPAEYIHFRAHITRKYITSLFVNN